MKFNDLEKVIVISTGESVRIVDEFKNNGICYYEVEMKINYEISVKSILRRMLSFWQKEYAVHQINAVLGGKV